MPRFVVYACALPLAFLPAHTEVAQNSRDSYHHLSTRGRQLFDDLAQRRGEADFAAAYNDLRVSQRTTFEAIIHAMEFLDIDQYVQTVDKIWGKATISEWADEGRHQFRLSVTLTEDATKSLRARDDFRSEPFGHVKQPNGDLVGGSQRDVVGLTKYLLDAILGQTDCVRQESGAGEASLQVSWLQDNPTVGDIDIDYRVLGERHTEPDNSDIRSSTDTTPHFDIHILTYGGSANALPNWWR
ncbi:MAG: hypothetical protein OXS47_11700 [Chloroflexota bacterium]|nr:hypothetical protein [Chloroflexota bacterium]